MTYTTNHALLTILGDSFGMQEEWQTGVRLVGDNTPPTTAEFEAVNAAVQTFIGNNELKVGQGFRYIGLKWAPQDVNGKYGAEGESITWLRPSPGQGQGTDAGYPQIAIVLSLRTSRTRGYASNGRMYFPSTMKPTAADGLIAAGSASAVATAAATMIQSINAAGMGQVAVMSKVGAGRTELVNAVRVGRVMDTQRRRRNGLPESYVPPVAVPL